MRCATIASFKVRFCLLVQHEEAVLEDEEAKHIERMMMRCVSALYEWRKGRHFPKEEKRIRKKETRRNEDDKNDSEGQRFSPSHFGGGFGV